MPRPTARISRPARPAFAPLALALLAAAPLACTERRDADVGATSVNAEHGPASPPLPEQPLMGAPALADEAASMVMRVRAPRAESAGAASSGFGGAGRPPRASGAATAADSAAPSAPDMVIRRGQASVRVDSLDAAVARVRQLAARVGGVVANSSLRSGRDQVRSATIEIRVPAPRFDELVAGLEPFGKVETVDVSVEDVGEEFVDVSARVANARRLEARLTDILAKRTGKLSEVLAVERELARVREEIERYEGRLRYLRAHSAVSSLAVTVHEPPPILAGPPSANPVTHAFVQAWRNFVALLAATIAAMGVLVPVAVVAGLGWLGVRRVRQGAGRREAA